VSIVPIMPPVESRADCCGFVSNQAAATVSPFRNRPGTCTTAKHKSRQKLQELPARHELEIERRVAIFMGIHNLNFFGRSSRPVAARPKVILGSM
jgi:queuine/archaeosine tRNA-ribosyltransferase